MIASNTAEETASKDESTTKVKRVETEILKTDLN